MLELGLSLPKHAMSHTKWWPDGFDDLAIDFVNNRAILNGSATSIADILSITRASSAWSLDAKNNFSEVSTNTLNITNNGLHISDARTNVVPNAIDALQWPLESSSGSLTDTGEKSIGDITFNRVSIESSGASWHRANFLSNHSLNANDKVAITLYLMAGTSGQFNLVISRASDSTESFFNGTLGGATSTDNTIGTWSQLSQRSFTIDNETVYEIKAVFEVNQTTNYTYAIGPNTTDETIIALGAQVEVSNFSTPFIPTYGSAAARQNDFINFSDTSWFDGIDQPGTFFVEATCNQPTDDSQLFRLLRIRGVNSSNTIELTNEGVTGRIKHLVRASPQGVLNYDYIQGQAFKSSFAYATNDAATSFDGSSVAQDTSVGLPTGPITNIGLGNNTFGGEIFNGIIHSIFYSKTRQPDAILQNLSS